MRPAEDLEVRPGRGLARPPAQPRQDDDLLARVAAHPRAVRAGDDRQRKRVDATPDEHVAPVDPGRAQLDERLARAGLGIVHLLEAELRPFVCADGLH